MNISFDCGLLVGICRAIKNQIRHIELPIGSFQAYAHDFLIEGGSGICRWVYVPERWSIIMKISGDEQT